MSLPALAGGPLETLVLEGGVLSCIAKSIWAERGATAMPALTHEESLHPALGQAPNSPDRVRTIQQDGLLPQRCTECLPPLRHGGGGCRGRRGRPSPDAERSPRTAEVGSLPGLHARHRLVRA